MASDEMLIRMLEPVAAALVTGDDARRARDHDAAIGRGGTVKGNRVRGRLPASTSGVVQAASVELAPSAFSGTRNLADRIAAIEAAIAALEAGA